MKINFVAALIIFVFSSALAWAQAVEETQLERIVVTNRRSPVSLADASENIVVISADEIRQLPCRDLGEVLQYVAGVNVAPRQGFGRPTSVTIQGSDSRQVKIMIDGIPLNTQSSGQVNLPILPVENIDRIEIIKGASSSLWGSALGGVINVITKETGTTKVPQGNLTTTFAEFKTQKKSGEITGKVGDLGYFVSSSYMESNGGLRDDVLEKKIFSKLSYDLGESGRLITSFGYSGADVNSGIFPGDSWQAQPYRFAFGKLGWSGKIVGADTSVDLKHSRLLSSLKLFAAAGDAEPFMIIRNEDYLNQLSINVTLHPRQDDLLVVGTDFDWDIVKSDTYLSKAKSVSLQAPYANYTLKCQPWDFNAGLRLDRNSEFGEEFSPSMGLVYHVNDAKSSLIRLGVSHAFNAPPLLWKYNENLLLGTVGNPDIGPEHAWVYEAGYQTRPISRLLIKLSVYRSDVWDALASADNGSGFTLMKNYDKFTRQGAEAQFIVSVLDELAMTAGGEFNHIVNDRTNKIVKGGGKPRQAFNLGIDYKTKKGLNLDLKGFYYNWNEPDSSNANDKKIILDFRLAQQVKFATLFVIVHNLTNSKYWQNDFFPSPRRYFEGGVKIEW